MGRCNKCVMPEVEHHILLDSNGICNVCVGFDHKKIMSMAEKDAGGYDALINKINRHKGDSRGDVP